MSNIVIEYGMHRTQDGWMPAIRTNGRRWSGWTSKVYDRDEALALAKLDAEEEAARFVGDWNVTVKLTEDKEFLR